MTSWDEARHNSCTYHDVSQEAAMDITERKITEITREAEKLEAKGYFVRRDAPTTGAVSCCTPRKRRRT